MVDISLIWSISFSRCWMAFFRYRFARRSRNDDIVGSSGSTINAVFAKASAAVIFLSAIFEVALPMIGPLIFLYCMHSIVMSARIRLVNRGQPIGLIFYDNAGLDIKSRSLVRRPIIWR